MLYHWGTENPWQDWPLGLNATRPLHIARIRNVESVAERKKFFFLAQFFKWWTILCIRKTENNVQLILFKIIQQKQFIPWVKLSILKQPRPEAFCNSYKANRILIILFCSWNAKQKHKPEQSHLWELGEFIFKIMKTFQARWDLHGPTCTVSGSVWLSRTSRPKRFVHWLTFKTY